MRKLFTTISILLISFGTFAQSTKIYYFEEESAISIASLITNNIPKGVKTGGKKIKFVTNSSVKIEKSNNLAFVSSVTKYVKKTGVFVNIIYELDNNDLVLSNIEFYKSNKYKMKLFDAKINIRIVGFENRNTTTDSSFYNQSYIDYKKDNYLSNRIENDIDYDSYFIINAIQKEYILSSDTIEAVLKKCTWKKYYCEPKKAKIKLFVYVNKADFEKQLIDYYILNNQYYTIVSNVSNKNFRFFETNYSKSLNYINYSISLSNRLNLPQEVINKLEKVNTDFSTTVINIPIDPYKKMALAIEYSIIANVDNPNTKSFFVNEPFFSQSENVFEFSKTSFDYKINIDTIKGFHNPKIEINKKSNKFHWESGIQYVFKNRNGQLIDTLIKYKVSGKTYKLHSSKIFVPYNLMSPKLVVSFYTDNYLPQKDTIRDTTYSKTKTIFLEKKCSKNKLQEDKEIKIKVVNTVTGKPISGVTVFWSFVPIDNEGKGRHVKLQKMFFKKRSKNTNNKGEIKFKVSPKKDRIYFYTEKENYLTDKGYQFEKLNCREKEYEIQIDMATEEFKINCPALVDIRTDSIIKDGVIIKIIEDPRNKIDFQKAKFSTEVASQKVFNNHNKIRINVRSKKIIVGKKYYDDTITLSLDTIDVFNDTLFVEPATRIVKVCFINPKNNNLYRDSVRFRMKSTTDSTQFNEFFTYKGSSMSIEVPKPLLFYNIYFKYHETDYDTQVFAANLKFNTVATFFIGYTVDTILRIPVSSFTPFYYDKLNYFKNNSFCKNIDSLKMAQLSKDISDSLMIFKNSGITTNNQQASKYYFLEGLNFFLKYKLKEKTIFIDSAVNILSFAINTFNDLGTNQGDDLLSWYNALSNIDYYGCVDCNSRLYDKFAIYQAGPCSIGSTTDYTEELVSTKQLLDFNCTILSPQEISSWRYKVSRMNDTGTVAYRNKRMCEAILTVQEFKNCFDPNLLATALDIFIEVDTLFLTNSPLKERIETWIDVLSNPAERGEGCTDCKNEYYDITASHGACPNHTSESIKQEILKLTGGFNLDINVYRDSNDLVIKIITLSNKYSLGYYWNANFIQAIRLSLKIANQHANIMPDKHIEITGWVLGEADGYKVNKDIEFLYDSLGDFQTYYYSLRENDILDSATNITNLIGNKKSIPLYADHNFKITNNHELALMRAYVVFHTLENYGLSISDDFKIFTKANKSKGPEFRRTTAFIVITDYYNVLTVPCPKPFNPDKNDFVKMLNQK